MDRRLTPSNGRVAAAGLQGAAEAARFVTATPQQVCVGVADLLHEPGAIGRERQLLYGEDFNVLEVANGYAFGQSSKDGYVGYIRASELGEPVDATHVVTSRATHLYAAADIKSADIHALSFGARLRIVSAEGSFFETHNGLFVPKPHVRPAKVALSDPASVAQLFFGAPYLWGGNGSAGIDCSGLVQAAFLACGHACPGDADMQQETLGTLTNDSEFKRGDLVFWKGHVAIVVDGETLIHANAFAMAVTYEPIEAAIERIAAQGEGPVSAHKRL